MRLGDGEDVDEGLSLEVGKGQRGNRGRARRGGTHADWVKLDRGGGEEVGGVAVGARGVGQGEGGSVIVSEYEGGGDTVHSERVSGDHDSETKRDDGRGERERRRGGGHELPSGLLGNILGGDCGSNGQLCIVVKVRKHSQ